MDKRTLIFVLALTLALFGVNLYFENQREKSWTEWNEQEKVKLAQQEKQLRAEITSQTANLADLPLVDLYAESSGTTFLTTGVKTDSSVLTMPWDAEIPPIIFSRPHGGSERLQKLTLHVLPDNKEGIILYQPDDAATAFPVGKLPDFGKFTVQLVTPQTEIDAPATIRLGHYVDGHLTIPQQQLQQVNQKLQSEKSTRPSESQSAIVLLKQDSRYIPVAFYYGSSKELLHLDAVPNLQRLITKTKESSTATPSRSSTEETFYVIENPYLQLVFSNYGGALAEINLPFASNTNTSSVVREIEFDREITANHPLNARFPLHPYVTSANGENDLKEHSEGALGGYYPLIRRDLINKDRKKTVRIKPQYYALNIVSEFPEVAELIYEVKKFDKQSITFEAKQTHRRITKTFSLEEAAPYCVNLAIQVDGDSHGLWLSSGIPEVEWISGGPAPALKYRITRQQKSTVELIDLPQETLTVTSVYPDWICNSNGFLGLIQDPLTKIDPGYRAQKVAGTAVPSRLVLIESEFERFKADQMPGYSTMLPLKSTNEAMNFRIFSGPFATSILNRIDEKYSDPVTGYNPDYIAAQTFHGWFAFISEPFAKFLLILMRFFYNITGSWGFSIILLTVALRVMMYPLNAWSNKSMLRMQQIAPEVTAIQNKYKSDPKKAQMEIVNLYRDKGVNPMSGCLPMLLQMPFLIGMFDLLKSTFELRGASFVPGWIDDLASPDVLFRWNTPLPLIGNEFHLLPFLLGAVMFVQQRFMTTAPRDPNQMTDQQRQQRAMGSIMSIVFTVMFYSFPSGLNIYWLSSMLLGIAQQWWSTRKLRAPAQTQNVKKIKG